jgi:hypothetical protein
MVGEPSDPRLAKYRLGRVLGAGGMGEVRLAHDEVLNRDVAIKFISPDHAADSDWARRLVREARSAAALDHPAICAVYEVNADPGHSPFIVMQYVEGETLGSKIRRAPMEPRDALRLTAQIADALATAHRRGIVHRDLKPENVMITDSGHPKLLDFGIARITALAGHETIETRTSLTVEGSFVGTPSYMSPEQIEQRSIDGRSDLFSLGCVLYECLTGRPAFTGATTIEICAAVLHVHPPPPSAVRPELTDRYDELCRRLLAKDPSQRFQSAEELLGALQILLPTTDVPSRNTNSRGLRPPHRTMSRRKVAGGLAAALLVAGASGAWWYRSTRGVMAPEAARWYDQGVEHLRNAAYHSARKAFEEAIRLSPAFPQAYTRLAEAQIELDEESEAKDALLNVDRSTLGPDDRHRYDAVNALATGKPDVAVAAYRLLATGSRADAGAWVDLGRAQSLANLPLEARVSFARALEIGGQYPAAHLQMAILDADAGRREEALARLADAERLYRAASDLEGEAEAILRSGTLLATLNEVDRAQKTLTRALSLAAAQQNRSQQIRGEIGLATIKAARGDLTGAEKQATAAVNRALDARLDAVAANGLVDLAIVLMRKQEFPEAIKHLQHAALLSQRRRAPRSSLRARLQLASAMVSNGQSAQGGATAETMLPELRQAGYVRWEMTALSIAARAHENLGSLARARELTAGALSLAEKLGDERQYAIALDNLAGQLTALGALPEALAYRERREAIHRRQKDNGSLVFDLQTRAELLIRLGRAPEAEVVLRELEAGAAAGIEVFRQRARRVKLLRALQATIDEQFEQAARLAFDVVRVGAAAADSTTQFSVLLLDHALSRGARSPGRWTRPPDLQRLSNAQVREMRYWRLAVLAARGEDAATVASAQAALKEFATSLSFEDRWRIAAAGSAAAARLGDPQQASALAAVATKSLDELRSSWKTDAYGYLKRRDLVRLRVQAGLLSSTR